MALNYLGHRLRLHRDPNGGLWFVLADIFRALDKRNTGTMRKRIKNPSDLTLVRAWVTNTVNPKDSGYRMIQAVSERGMQTMLGVSKQQDSIDLLQWLNQTVLTGLSGVA